MKTTQQETQQFLTNRNGENFKVSPELKQEVLDLLIKDKKNKLWRDSIIWTKGSNLFYVELPNKKLITFEINKPTNTNKDLQETNKGN